MISSSSAMVTPKTQQNFGSARLGQGTLSSSKKNYHPRENKAQFGKSRCAGAFHAPPVDWSSKSSSRVKLGLADRKISEPHKIQRRTFETNSPKKVV